MEFAPVQHAWPACPSSACLASVPQFSTHGKRAPVQHAWQACPMQFSTHGQHAPIQHAWPACSSSAHMASVPQFSMHGQRACPSSARMASMLQFSTHRHLSVLPDITSHAWPLPLTACIPVGLHLGIFRRGAN